METENDDHLKHLESIRHSPIGAETSEEEIEQVREEEWEPWEEEGEDVEEDLQSAQCKIFLFFIRKNRKKLRVLILNFARFLIG